MIKNNIYKYFVWMGTSCYNQVWPSKFGTNFFTFPLFFVLITQIEACNVIGLNVRSQRIDYRGDAFNWFYSMYSTCCSNIICWRCRMHSKLVKRDIVQHSKITKHNSMIEVWNYSLVRHLWLTSNQCSQEYWQECFRKWTRWTDKLMLIGYTRSKKIISKKDIVFVGKYIIEEWRKEFKSELVLNF